MIVGNNFYRPVVMPFKGELTNNVKEKEAARRKLEYGLVVQDCKKLKSSADLSALEIIRAYVDIYGVGSTAYDLPDNSSSFINKLKGKPKRGNAPKAGSYNKVDFNNLKKMKGVYALEEKVEGSLYTGSPIKNIENAEIAKEAGIKTIIFLGSYSYPYNEKNMVPGIKYAWVKKDMGSHQMADFEFGLIKQIIDNPEIYSDPEETDKRIEALKTYLDILDGKNENYPPPVYMGCANGITRTDWFVGLYQILRLEQDSEKPLSKETIEKLIKFYNEQRAAYADMYED